MHPAHDRHRPYRRALTGRVRTASRDLVTRVGATVAAVALLVGLAGCTGGPTGSAPVFQMFAPEDRQAAPTLTGDLVDGSGAYDPATHAGQVLVINFWGSWCGPCLAEAPELEAVRAAFQDQGLAFLGVSVRDNLDNARGFAAQYTSFPSIFDKSSKIALGFAVHPNAVPATIVLDRQGRIAAVARSPLIRSDLEPVVVALLEETG